MLIGLIVLGSLLAVTFLIYLALNWWQQPPRKTPDPEDHAPTQAFKRHETSTDWRRRD